MLLGIRLPNPVTQVLGGRRSDGEVGLSLFFTSAWRPFRVVMPLIRELLPMKAAKAGFHEMNAYYSNSISTRFVAPSPFSFWRTRNRRAGRTEHAVHGRSGSLPQLAESWMGVLRSTPAKQRHLLLTSRRLGQQTQSLSRGRGPSLPRPSPPPRASRERNTRASDRDT
jgi:hypothetical protein